MFYEICLHNPRNILIERKLEKDKIVSNNQHPINRSLNVDVHSRRGNSDITTSNSTKPINTNFLSTKAESNHCISQILICQASYWYNGHYISYLTIISLYSPGDSHDDCSKVVQGEADHQSPNCVTVYTKKCPVKHRINTVFILQLNNMKTCVKQSRLFQGRRNQEGWFISPPLSTTFPDPGPWVGPKPYRSDSHDFLIPPPRTFQIVPAPLDSSQARVCSVSDELFKRQTVTSSVTDTGDLIHLTLPV